MYQIRKVFKFEGAHVLTSSYSKECQRIHGHSYRVEVFLKSDSLNRDGMIMDFKMLKERVKFLVDMFDHKLVVDINNPDEKLLGLCNMTSLNNPTAENMAKFLYDEMKDIVPLVSKVRIHETESGWAEYWDHRV